MAVFCPRAEHDSLPVIPDDLTISQFVFEYEAPFKPHRDPDAPCFIEAETGRRLYASDVARLTSALANGLRAQWGIDYPIIIWAVHKLGGIISPANPVYTANELAHQFEIAKAKAVIASVSALPAATAAAKKAGISMSHVACLPSAEEMAPQGILTVQDLIQAGNREKKQYQERRFEPGEAKTKVALLAFSSGTTGKFCAVVITHYAVIANLCQLCSYWRTDLPDGGRFHLGDSVAAVLPFFRQFLLISSSRAFWKLFRNIGSHCCREHHIRGLYENNFIMSHNSLVPPQIVLLCKSPLTRSYDLSSVRTVMASGAPMSAEIVNQLTTVVPGAWVIQGYGMTETVVIITVMPFIKGVSTPGSAGRLINGLSIKIIKDAGGLAKENEPGEIYCRGLSFASGYLNNEKATKETFLDDGWLRTGDVGYMKNDELFVIDRAKELIKVRSFQVSPAELEGHLLTHPAVNEVCVVGAADDYSGEVPVAFVVLKPEFAQKVSAHSDMLKQLEQDIIKYVADNKSRFKWLAGGVRFVDAIPKNPTGKMLRRALRDEVNRTRAKARL
ncbi:acetyl-CoA synthetase-like protein [Fistulina hepatica ATCC 64428]|uniref:Acetyl-CoA synthetase-like protein n=1 Tax=Fistulina hepatica ATCC 64428 TaxID=1128425 RepID=A0A0D7AN21_9AGAR|nr:acetyl-CoA synthetase-like protein [Fistulina hepatica ATCC 64428]